MLSTITTNSVIFFVGAIAARPAYSTVLTVRSCLRNSTLTAPMPCAGAGPTYGTGTPRGRKLEFGLVGSNAYTIDPNVVSPEMSGSRFVRQKCGLTPLPARTRAWLPAQKVTIACGHRDSGAPAAARFARMPSTFGFGQSRF